MRSALGHNGTAVLGAIKMQEHELESKIADLEFRLTMLERNGKAPKAQDPTTALEIAVEQTIGVLSKWRENKEDVLDNEDYDDYRDVISTLPLLEKTFNDWKRERKTKRPRG